MLNESLVLGIAPTISLSLYKKELSFTGCQEKMPPKKVEEKNPPILGRLGTNLKMGILGLPNVGKSTFFNVLTKSEAQAENFPFCTIDPNEARVVVKDDRYDWLVEHFKPLSRVPAFLNVVDIAGLVKGL
jgi:obg-like ATPase 1